MKEGHELLLIEDNPADAMLVREWFRAAARSCTLNVVRDGAEALDYLFRRGAFAGAARPDLILLDLNIPKVDGREVLRQLKGNDSLRRVPVVVMTTSNSDKDILDTYDMGANAFVCKPLGLDEVDAMMTSIDHFWLATVRLPNR